MTRKERLDAEASLFGIQRTMPDLSAEEIQRMREIIARHDGQKNQIETFDLNNPPKVAYVHQEYPRLMYHPTMAPRLAHSDEDVSAAIEKGWSKTPIVESKPTSAWDAPEDPELDEDEAAEANEMQAAIKRGRGRPRKDGSPAQPRIPQE